MNRLFIYPKDVSAITGKGQRWSQRLLRDIRFAMNKGDHQLVTIKEFSDYMGIELHLVAAVCK